MPVTGMPEVIADRVQTCPRCGDTYDQAILENIPDDTIFNLNYVSLVKCGYCHCIYPVCKGCGQVCLELPCQACTNVTSEVTMPDKGSVTETAEVEVENG
jgi:hypothetical protein